MGRPGTLLCDLCRSPIASCTSSKAFERQEKFTNWERDGKENSRNQRNIISLIRLVNWLRRRVSIPCLSNKVNAYNVCLDDLLNTYSTKYLNFIRPKHTCEKNISPTSPDTITKGVVKSFSWNWRISCVELVG